MYWVFNLLVWNPQRRGMYRYWWTGRSYPFIKGFRTKRKAIWDREIRDATPFEGSVFKESVRTAVNGKLSSWSNLFRISTWKQLNDLLTTCKEIENDD